MWSNKRREMRWNRSREMRGIRGLCLGRIFLTAAHTARTGWGNKSEVTLQVPSISRLFYMGSSALMGEPSMEQSWESHDGMAGLRFARWLIGWAPSSTQVTLQWVVLTSWWRQRYTAVQLGAKVCSGTPELETQFNTHLLFAVCCNFLYICPSQERRHKD